MQESRNMLIESARISRGNIKNINDITPADIDALVIPGGFGSAKNFTDWAFNGPDGKKWKEEVRTEHGRMVQSGVFERVKRSKLPSDVKVIDTVWVMKKKSSSKL